MIRLGNAFIDVLPKLDNKGSRHLALQVERVLLPRAARMSTEVGNKVAENMTKPLLDNIGEATKQLVGIPDAIQGKKVSGAVTDSSTANQMMTTPGAGSSESSGGDSLTIGTINLTTNNPDDFLRQLEAIRQQMRAKNG